MIALRLLAAFAKQKSAPSAPVVAAKSKPPQGTNVKAAPLQLKPEPFEISPREQKALKRVGEKQAYLMAVARCMSRVRSQEANHMRQGYDELTSAVPYHSIVEGEAAPSAIAKAKANLLKYQ